MTRENLIDELMKSAKAHNNAIDHFENVELKEYFGKDEVNASQWFEAQRLINAQDFYTKGKAILDVLRALGIDCKMNMQNDKLVLNGEYI